jgi:hypothetical protein
MEYLAHVVDLADGAHQYGNANPPDGDQVSQAESAAGCLPIADRQSAFPCDFAGGGACVSAGRTGGFIAILVSRLNRIVDRTVVLNGIPDDDAARARLKTDLPRLMRRAAMMNRAIFWAVVASLALTVLVIVAFVTALLQVQHERGVAIFFLISLGAFTISLIDFAREVRIALSEFDHHA